MIYALPVQVGNFLSGQLLELSNAANAPNLVAARRYPDGHRRAPVPVPAHRPVPGVLQPVAEPLVLDKVGHPVSRAARLLQLLGHVLHPDEP